MGKEPEPDSSTGRSGVTEPAVANPSSVFDGANVAEREIIDFTSPL